MDLIPWRNPNANTGTLATETTSDECCLLLLTNNATGTTSSIGTRAPMMRCAV